MLYDTRPLGEICRVKYGKGLSKKDRQQGDIPVMGSNGQVDCHNEGITNNPCIVIGRKGSIGQVHLVETSCWPIDTAYFLDEWENEIDPSFLFFWLKTAGLTLKNKAGAIPSLLRPDLESVLVPIMSISEQRRIVARIKDCMERVKEIEDNALVIGEELNSLFLAMLHEQFTGLSNEVPVACLEDVTEIKGGGSLPEGMKQDIGKGCVLLVKVGDMNEPGNERTIEVSREYIAAEKASKNVIQPGAIVFPKRGGAIATNKKRMLGRPAMIDPNLMAVVALPKKLLSEYLYYWTLALDLTQISNGGVIPQLNRKDLAPLIIPVPDLDRQNAIINELEQAEAAWIELQKTFSAANLERSALRESILRKAFAGEL